MKKFAIAAALLDQRFGSPPSDTQRRTPLATAPADAAPRSDSVIQGDVDPEWQHFIYRTIA